MNRINVDKTLDAKGLACPMPIVRTKKEMNNLESGQVLEIQATDKGSKADLKAWADSTGHHYIGTVETDGVLIHYIRKSSDESVIERRHEKIISTIELEQLVKTTNNIVIVDVREAAEYAFNHIENAVSIPLGELESRLGELRIEDRIYVVCRSGNRSDLAAQILVSNEYKNVTNVLPGMSGWSGETVKSI